MNAADIKVQLAAAKAEVKRLEDELHNATIAESGVEIGQRYRRTTSQGHGSDRKTVVEMGQVTSFPRLYGNDTRPMLTLFKADGTLGVRTTTMSLGYPTWELVEEKS